MTKKRVLFLALFFLPLSVAKRYMRKIVFPLQPHEMEKEMVKLLQLSFVYISIALTLKNEL